MRQLQKNRVRRLAHQACRPHDAGVGQNKLLSNVCCLQTIVSSQEDSQSTTLCSAERSLAAGSASSTATMAESAAADQTPAAVRTAEVCSAVLTILLPL